MPFKELKEFRGEILEEKTIAERDANMTTDMSDLHLYHGRIAACNMILAVTSLSEDNEAMVDGALEVLEMFYSYIKSQEDQDAS